MYSQFYLSGFDPGMLWIVFPGPVGSAFTGQDPGVVQRIAGTGDHGVIATWNQHGIAVLDGVGVVERLWIGRVGVDAHEAKTLSRLNLEVIHFFHWDLRGRIEAVVLMRWTARPSAGAVQGFAGDQMGGVDIVGDVGEDRSGPIILSDLFGDSLLGADNGGLHARLTSGAGN